MMTPPWMIEELKRQRSERDARRRPQLEIPLPEPLVRERPEHETHREPIVIEF